MSSDGTKPHVSTIRSNSTCGRLMPPKGREGLDGECHKLAGSENRTGGKELASVMEVLNMRTKHGIS